MKASELREIGLEELQGKERELREQAFRLRMQKATGQLDNAVKVRQVRREIARLLTVIGQKRKAASSRQQGE